MCQTDLPAGYTMNFEDQLRCELECARLCNDFAWTVDARDYVAFVALFATGGIFDRGGQKSIGHEAIREFLDARPVDRVTRHICTNMRFDMTGPDTATGTCSALMYQAPAAKEAQPSQLLPLSPPVVVDYVDAYVLTGGGWKFKCRKASVVFSPA